MTASPMFETFVEFRGQHTSVSEIEFCTPYAGAEPWILVYILRFMHAKNHFSDTLIPVAAILGDRYRGEDTIPSPRRGPDLEAARHDNGRPRMGCPRSSPFPVEAAPV